MDTYRRIQLARYLIDNRISEGNRFDYDLLDRINDFGIPHSRLSQIIDSGEPFRTSGCTGYDGLVACNRPYANSRPGPNIRNYPFPPTPKDVLRIQKQFSFK